MCKPLLVKKLNQWHSISLKYALESEWRAYFQLQKSLLPWYADRGWVMGASGDEDVLNAIDELLDSGGKGREKTRALKEILQNLMRCQKLRRLELPEGGYAERAGLNIIANESGENSFTMYPNPSAGELKFILRTEETSGAFTFQIRDLQGKIIIPSLPYPANQWHSISLEYLPYGVYIIEAHNSQNKFIQKWIKK